MKLGSGHTMLSRFNRGNGEARRASSAVFARQAAKIFHSFTGRLRYAGSAAAVESWTSGNRSPMGVPGKTGHESDQPNLVEFDPFRSLAERLCCDRRIGGPPMADQGFNGSVTTPSLELTPVEVRDGPSVTC
jgi:hypothetical protein